MFATEVRTFLSKSSLKRHFPSPFSGSTVTPLWSFHRCDPYPFTLSGSDVDGNPIPRMILIRTKNPQYWSHVMNRSNIFYTFLYHAFVCLLVKLFEFFLRWRDQFNGLDFLCWFLVWVRINVWYGLASKVCKGKSDEKTHGSLVAQHCILDPKVQAPPSISRNALVRYSKCNCDTLW